MTRPHIVSSISKILQEIAPDSRRILYGSEARGEARADSDIDILVILPDDRESYAERKISITEKLYDIELSTGVTISPLIVLKSLWERMRTPFTINVARDGIDL